METHPPGPGILGLEALFHEPGPHPAGRTKFGDLLKKIDVGVEEKGKAGGKGIHIQASFYSGLDVGQAIRQGEGQLLNRRGPRFPNVIAADTDRIPSGDLPGPKFYRIRDQPQGRAGLCKFVATVVVQVYCRSGHWCIYWDPD